MTKREEYLAYGLLEYWIVDPLERQVTVLTRRGDAWNEAVFRDDQVIGSLVLPGFATTVAELWIDVDSDDDDPYDPGANGLWSVESTAPPVRTDGAPGTKTGSVRNWTGFRGRFGRRRQVSRHGSRLRPSPRVAFPKLESQLEPVLSA